MGDFTKGCPEHRRPVPSFTYHHHGLSASRLTPSARPSRERCGDGLLAIIVMNYATFVDTHSGLQKWPGNIDWPL